MLLYDYVTSIAIFPSGGPFLIPIGQCSGIVDSILFLLSCYHNRSGAIRGVHMLSKDTNRHG